jgi:hypothetical protein
MWRERTPLLPGARARLRPCNGACDNQKTEKSFAQKSQRLVARRCRRCQKKKCELPARHCSCRGGNSSSSRRTHTNHGGVPSILNILPRHGAGRRCVTHHKRPSPPKIPSPKIYVFQTPLPPKNLCCQREFRHSPLLSSPPPPSTEPNSAGERPVGDLLMSKATNAASLEYENVSRRMPLARTPLFFFGKGFPFFVRRRLAKAQGRRVRN